MWSECWLDEELRHILQSEEGGAAWEDGSANSFCLTCLSGKKHAIFKHLPCTFCLGEHHSGRAPNIFNSCSRKG